MLATVDAAQLILNKSLLCRRRDFRPAHRPQHGSLLRLSDRL